MLVDSYVHDSATTHPTPIFILIFYGTTLLKPIYTTHILIYFSPFWYTFLPPPHFWTPGRFYQLKISTLQLSWPILAYASSYFSFNFPDLTAKIKSN